MYHIGKKKKGDCATGDDRKRPTTGVTKYERRATADQKRIPPRRLTPSRNRSLSAGTPGAVPHGTRIRHRARMVRTARASMVLAHKEGERGRGANVPFKNKKEPGRLHQGMRRREPKRSSLRSAQHLALMRKRKGVSGRPRGEAMSRTVHSRSFGRKRRRRATISPCKGPRPSAGRWAMSGLGAPEKKSMIRLLRSRR